MLINLWPCSRHPDEPCSSCLDCRADRIRFFRALYANTGPLPFPQPMSEAVCHDAGEALLTMPRTISVTTDRGEHLWGVRYERFEFRDGFVVTPPPTGER